MAEDGVVVASLEIILWFVDGKASPSIQSWVQAHMRSEGSRFADINRHLIERITGESYHER